MNDMESFVATMVVVWLIGCLFGLLIAWLLSDAAH